MLIDLILEYAALVWSYAFLRTGRILDTCLQCGSWPPGFIASSATEFLFFLQTIPTYFAGLSKSISPRNLLKLSESMQLSKNGDVSGSNEVDISDPLAIVTRILSMMIRKKWPRENRTSSRSIFIENACSTQSFWEEFDLQSMWTSKIHKMGLHRWTNHRFDPLAFCCI